MAAVLLVAGGVCSLAAGGLTAALGGRWVVRDLGVRYGLSAEGSPYSAFLGTAINERGQVVGTHDTGGHVRAFLWQQGRVRDLGVLPGDTDSRAVALNDRGQIVVMSWKGYGDTGHAYLWDNGRTRRLPPLPPTARANRPT